jgi:hypothetical protein
MHDHELLALKFLFTLNNDAQHRTPFCHLFVSLLARCRPEEEGRIQTPPRKKKDNKQILTANLVTTQPTGRYSLK